LNHKVVVLDDLSNGNFRNLKNVQEQITLIKQDVSVPFSLSDLNAVFHLACFPRSRSFENPRRDIEVNVIGIVNILELARKNDAKVIFSSNSGIYDTCRIPIDENTPDDPKTPYDLDKLQAENYMKLYGNTYGIEYVIFRFATVYGPRQNVSPEWKPVVMEFISRLRKKQAPTIYWDGEQTRDFIYVDDIVNALILSLENEDANGETIILGSQKETSINDLYNIVSDLVGIYIEPLRKPKKLGDIRRMRYDCKKANTILGWKADTPLEEGIKKIIETK
jgi:UDP-glucose 4-epimerase